MRTLCLIMLLGIQTDTSKVTTIYRKIDQKTEQISRQMSKPHTLDDIYRLQIKTDKVLLESHQLSKSLLLKGDSSAVVLKQTKALLLLSLNNQQRIIDGNRQLSAEVKTGKQARNELNVINNVIENGCLFMFWGFVIIALCRVLMGLKWPHLITAHK